MLSEKDRKIHQQGLVSVLKELRDELDQAAFDAYDWPHDLSVEEILQRLVDLNAQRVAEEEQGVIRYLRPEFQNPDELLHLLADMGQLREMEDGRFVG